jgi:hypothetical protein
MTVHVAWPTRPVDVVVLVLLVASPVSWVGCRQAQVDESPSARVSHPAAAAADEPREEPADGTTSEASNPVQAEMRLLTEAVRDWVTAIAQHDLGRIPEGIARVHAARLVTERALSSGAYVPPRGGAAVVEAFVRQDEAFHDELVNLLQAAKANDLPAATRQLGVVLEGCTTCHMQYRF